MQNIHWSRDEVVFINLGKHCKTFTEFKKYAVISVRGEVHASIVVLSVKIQNSDYSWTWYFAHFVVSNAKTNIDVFIVF